MATSTPLAPPHRPHRPRQPQHAPRRAGLAFAALTVLALIGFAKPYWLQLASQPTPWIHAHAAAMLSWCALLAAQPCLVAHGALAWHRKLGQLAWVLVPFIVTSSVVLAVVMTRPSVGGAIEPFRYSLFFVQLVSSAIFAVFAGLALWWRRERALHARCMVASGLVFIDPVLARVFTHWVGSPPWLLEQGSVVVSLLAMALVVAWERHATRGRAIFICLLLANMAMQAAALVIGAWAPWRALMERWLLA